MKRKALADQVVGKLLDDIVSGKFPPGSILPSEAELARGEEVSRLTVREAITVLRTKRVLEVQHGRGTFVSPISMWSPFDPALLAAKSESSAGVGTLPKKLIEARRLVEVGVAELAAARRTEEDLNAMEEALRRMETADGDIDSIANADIDFHQAIMSAAGNAVITALFSPIEHLVWEARRQTTAYLRMRNRAIEAHKRILKSIREKDPESARRTMQDHLVQTEEYLDDYVRKELEETSTTDGKKLIEHASATGS
jgi:DNA-binding FadR family transcriptional regulator